MRKILGVLLVMALVAAFGLTVYQGLRYARGKPVSIEQSPPRIVLKAPALTPSIDLSRGMAEDLWRKLEPTKINLRHQVMVLPWGKSALSPLTVKAFHNRKEIYFYLSWPDDTEDRVREANKFSDAGAIMFPLVEPVPPSALMMGFMIQSNLWQWRASQDQEYWQKVFPRTKAYADYYYPFEEKELFPVSRDLPSSAVNDLMAVRVGTLTPKATPEVSGRGFWKEGVWQVVFKRALASVDLESAPQFSFPGKRLIAFALWNGTNEDRGGRKSISDWVELKLE